MAGIEPYYKSSLIKLYHGNCLDLFPKGGENHISAIVTDPPYGLKFMDKDWDRGVPGILFWVEALRVLKPGGHLVAMGGSRTHHRLWCALEDAGFEIRDTLGWIHSEGFPKSKDLSDGWGTGLKSAWEPVALARKPLSESTIVANKSRWGTGGLNIDSCRIPTADNCQRKPSRASSNIYAQDEYTKVTAWGGRGHEVGRWPANIILDEEVAIELDAQSVDAGGASRFFYCAKASQAERQGSKHPTIKPVALMRYLVRLVGIPGGLILDPFAGSGSTLIAAAQEGFNSIGFELEEQSCQDARKRFEFYGV